MAINELQQRRVNLVTTLCQEGILDEHFTQLQQLQDEINPDFVQEVISLFFEDSQKMLNTLQNTLYIYLFSRFSREISNQEPVDYKKVDSCLNHFKGSSSRCLQCLQELKQEYYLLKDKLEILLKLEQQIRRAGGNICVAN